MISCLYHGWLSHRRLRPVQMSYGYAVFMFYLRLSELARLDRGGWLFGYNRWALFSFYDRDHGARDGGDLTAWIDNVLRQGGIACSGLDCRILCFPRIFGFVFNPLSILFCYDAAGALRAVLYEVKNTFGEQHVYAFPVPEGAGTISLQQNCPKLFYVSPFMAMEGAYHFRLTPPTSRFHLLIRQLEAGEDQLQARWTGKSWPWSTRRLWYCLIAYPCLTFKIITAIHWQGLKLFLKRVHFHHRPPLPSHAVTCHDPITGAIISAHDQ
jgi:uncharacterized protein